MKEAVLGKTLDFLICITERCILLQVYTLLSEILDTLNQALKLPLNRGRVSPLSFHMHHCDTITCRFQGPDLAGEVF